MKQGLFLLILYASTPAPYSFASETTEYYKCTTERGVVFNQTPCNSNSIAQKLEHHSPDLAIPDGHHVKQLNEIERKQIIRSLERKILLNKHKVAILDRETEQQRKSVLKKLDHVPQNSTAQRKAVRDVRRELQELDKLYAKELRALNKDTSDLERKLKKFSK